MKTSPERRKSQLVLTEYEVDQLKLLREQLGKERKLVWYQFRDRHNAVTRRLVLQISLAIQSINELLGETVQTIIDDGVNHDSE